ncbi:murein biosynthesis integral membrane protein MurJ [Wolbachia endosymbiont of Listronotus oregonensis]|uniref:murein biosynthesis integral membrane protein MurJ n=1 Tax=Wolbachia endosymbiont of Listronotus oregonensis TaxID=2969106 RepID=UPI00281532C6|nr:murein biosynthesis integral membrane protein MurJ [Wolbachia endosymbiont of Listronotus oregonensis]WMT84811.1 murein biosynthesis integral membrane protein MurJ [Wolbachia endosymbiont of Listronotus oregonensis]
MFKSIFTFSFFTAISRISGLIRDVLIATVIGANSLADIFFSSFRFANLFRAFFAEGAFTTSFIPLYSIESHDDKKAFNFASSVISITFIILVIFCLIMQTFSPYMIQIFAPGFDQSKFTLTVTLSRIMMPYIIFVSIVSLIGGMLQVKQHFASTAIAPIVLNLCLIISLFVPYIKTPAHNLSIAVLIGGIFQLLLILFSAYKLKAAFSFSLELSNEVRLFFKRVIPAIINNCVTQISVWIDTIMASFIPNAVSYIYYADRLNQLPQGIIGTAIGTVLLPLISKQVNNTENIVKIQNKALNIGLMLIMPTTAAFIIIPDIILLTLFSYGRFDHYAVQQTAPTLIAFSLSLPAFIINKVLLPTFFAKGNLKIPTMFSLMCLGINVVLNLLLMNEYQHTGIAIATSVSTWINSILLISYLTINKIYKVSQALLLNIMKIFVATVVMSIALYIFNSLLAGLFFDKILARIVYLTTLIALSVIVYFGILYLMFRGNLNNLKYV